MEGTTDSSIEVKEAEVKEVEVKEAEVKDSSAADFNVKVADAFTWMQSLESSTIDLLITDPPYESMEKWRKVGTTTRLKESKASSNKWFPVIPNSSFPLFFSEAFRILKPNAHCYVFCDQETMFAIKPMGEAAGFKFWKPLVWDKGPRLGMGYHYRAQHEFILFFEKGKRKLNDLGVADIIRVPMIVGGFPTEKPVAVSEVLVSQSSSVGDLIIDPFMGSGSTGVAALKAGRKFAGVDLQEEAVALTRQRLTTATKG